MKKTIAKIGIYLIVIIVFVMGFSLGYFISIPKHITIEVNLDDTFEEMTSDFVNISEIQRDTVELQLKYNCSIENE